LNFQWCLRLNLAQQYRDKDKMNNQESPLITRYFGAFIEILREADGTNGFSSYFLKHQFAPQLLEDRLRRIEGSGQTQLILREVEGVQDPNELDARLIDAWCELRLLDQLITDGFEHIRKEIQTVDFRASLGEHPFVFQVKHIRKSITEVINKFNERAHRR